MLTQIATPHLCMAKADIKQLKEIIDEVSSDSSHQKKIESFTKAFEIFTNESERLEKSYSALKEQFKELNEEFADVINQLNHKLIELDAVTYYLNSILSNISQGIFFIDLTGCVTTYNEAAQSILQIPSDQVLFHLFWDNFSDQAFGFSMREALASKTPTGVVYSSYERSPEERRELEVETSFVLRGDQNKGVPFDAMQGIIVLFRDITEIRALEIAAYRNDRLKELGEMAAMVAHDIRNPLGGIKGFASLLLRDLQDQPEKAQMARHIIEGTDNLNRLVTAILNYAKPIQLMVDSVDLVALVKDLFLLIQADSNFQTSIECILKASEKPMLVSVDRQLIKSALLNLAVNATQAMPKGGKLTIDLKRENHQVTLKVIDTGQGIKAENIKKLFTPFFTTRQNGNGFGLAEVLKIVQAHEGKINVKSEVDQGTEFTIIIPQQRKG